ncbi:MAG: O-antigen ligase family protein [Bacteroidales bacterium]|nr:O-antigen ligase family protein [Bacteroidales bacterium]
MKDKTKCLLNKLIFLSILFICLSIYLPPFFKSLSLTILALVLSVSFLLKAYSPKPNLNKAFILPIIFYSLHIIGLFYSSDKSEAIFDLQVKLPILILPLLFLFMPDKFLTKNYLFKYSIAIVIGLIINIFYCFTDGIIRSITNSSTLISEITYTKLSASLHPSYLSLFASVGLILSYIIPLEEMFKIRSNMVRIIKIAIASIITFFILMLNSRSGLIVLTIAYIWIIYDMFFLRKRRYQSIIILLIISISYIAIFNLNALSNRYNTAIESITETHTTNQGANSMSQRKFIYGSSLNLILEKPLFGQGTGDVRKSLNNLYEKNNVKFYSYLNAHNQFIQTTIALGLIGLIIILLLFIIPIINIIKSREYYLIAIYLIIGFSFLFESMLDRSMGAYFFILIYILSNIYIEDRNTNLRYLNL